MELSADMMRDSQPEETSAGGASAGRAGEGRAGEVLPVGGVVGERWPTLARAMGRYEQNVAERFSTAAYAFVEAGIIRLEDRRRLSSLADHLGLRPFEAQLLIACAIRKWGLDHAYDATPSRREPELSFEYKAWGRLWVRLALVACTAAILDGIIIWKWLS